MPYAKGDGPSVVIALGGNALGNSPQEQLWRYNPLLADEGKNPFTLDSK